MGLPVPHMRRPAAVLPTACHCTQCGAPHEAHASVCAYCLSPKAGQGRSGWDGYAFAKMTVELSAEQRIAAMVEVTKMGDAERRYVPAAQPAPMYL